MAGRLQASCHPRRIQMTYVIRTHPVLRPVTAVSRWLRRLRSWFGQQAEFARKRRQARRQLHILADMPDWQLRDIGIEPDDLRDALYRGRDTALLFEPIRLKDGNIGIRSRRKR